MGTARVAWRPWGYFWRAGDGDAAAADRGRRQPGGGRLPKLWKVELLENMIRPAEFYLQVSVLSTHEILELQIMQMFLFVRTGDRPPPGRVQILKGFSHFEGNP